MKLNKFKKVFLFFLVILFLFLPFFVLAVEFKPQVKIPGYAPAVGANPGETIFKYFAALYSWGIRAIGVIAVIMIMVAGFQWMLAGGNATKVSAAKERMKNSVIGLILVIGAYWILNFINPALVKSPKLNIEGIEPKKLVVKSSCLYRVFDFKKVEKETGKDFCSLGSGYEWSELANLNIFYCKPAYGQSGAVCSEKKDSLNLKKRDSYEKCERKSGKIECTGYVYNEGDIEFSSGTRTVGEEFEVGVGVGGGGGTVTGLEVNPYKNYYMAGDQNCEGLEKPKTKVGVNVVGCCCPKTDRGSGSPCNTDKDCPEDEICNTRYVNECLKPAEKGVGCARDEDCKSGKCKINWWGFKIKICE